MYATDYVITETKMEIETFEVSSDMPPSDDTETVWIKALKSSQVYTE